MWYSYENLHELYIKQKLSTRDIGGIYGKASCTVLYHLNKHGIETRSKAEALKLERARAKISKHSRGENNNMWNGGTKLLKGEYIGIHKPDHPYCNSQGYVPQHRLVMEDCLGRYLAPSEVVHHLDGDTKHNDISNLELYDNQSTHAKEHYKERNINSKGQFS